MAQIPWWVWIGVGLFVTLTSAFMGPTLRFFIWVGLIFLIVGIAKAVFLFVFKEKPAPQQKAPARYCMKCRVLVGQKDYFCRYCGTRLR